jgi:microcystin degradation protein MlrC
MRVGIAALMHESNTFISGNTPIDRFREDLFLTGVEVANQLAQSHHEIGGFFEGLRNSHDSAMEAREIEAFPLAAFRATPSGVLQAGLLDRFLDIMLSEMSRAGRLDGLLLAVHGAAVAEDQLDADGYWLGRLRESLNDFIPIIATLDAHANLSQQMVDAVDAFVAYRTNPHLDQKDRGIEAARMMVRTLTGEIRPTMAAAFPPMVINIERQGTSEPHWRPIYEQADRQLNSPQVLSNSVLLGFPYADVPKMGSATLVVTDDDCESAQRFADELADALWQARDSMVGQLISVQQAIDTIAAQGERRTCLLDMGDNVGGGSAADGTVLLEALHRSKIGPSFLCIFDPEAVQRCRESGVGSHLSLEIGGHTDQKHGNPYTMLVSVESMHPGRFSESEARHGGIREFDQGLTSIVRSIDSPLTIMLTTRRMVPFSLQQLRSCGIDPCSFRVLVARGVHAPLAAYREVCDAFVRVNTPGSTCADLHAMTFQHRRRPMFPWENPRRMGFHLS